MAWSARWAASSRSPALQVGPADDDQAPSPLDRVGQLVDEALGEQPGRLHLARTRARPRPGPAGRWWRTTCRRSPRRPAGPSGRRRGPGGRRTARCGRPAGCGRWPRTSGCRPRGPDGRRARRRRRPPRSGPGWRPAHPARRGPAATRRARSARRRTRPRRRRSPGRPARSARRGSGSRRRRRAPDRRPDRRCDRATTSRSRAPAASESSTSPVSQNEPYARLARARPSIRFALGIELGGSAPGPRCRGQVAEDELHVAPDPPGHGLAADVGPAR